MALPFGVQQLAGERSAALVADPTDYESPGFHVLYSNATGRVDTPSMTVYTFSRDDALYEMFSKYSGGLGLTIAGCSGINGTMRVWEPNGRMVEEFLYHGQSLIALCGWHLYHYLDGNLTSESWGSMENATMDWRAGVWEPTDGLMIERGNQTLGAAVLAMSYIVPGVIPEFSMVIVVGATAVLMLLIRRRMMG